MLVPHHAAKRSCFVTLSLSLSLVFASVYLGIETPSFRREVHQSCDEIQPLVEVRPQETQERPMYVQGCMPAVAIIEIELGALVPVVAPLEPSARFDQHREGYFAGRLRPRADQRHQRTSIEYYLSEVVVHHGPRTVRPGF